MTQLGVEANSAGDDMVVLKNELTALRKQVKQMNEEHNDLLTTIKEKNERIMALSRCSRN